MSDKGKGKMVADLSSFSHAEWARVLSEVVEMECWKRKEGESLFHFRERIRTIYTHARGQLEALERTHEGVGDPGKDRNPDPLVTPNPNSLPTPGAQSSAVVSPAPSSPVLPPRGLVLENEVVVETESEEDPEEDPEEDQVEEEVEVVELSDVEMEAVLVEDHPIIILSEGESEDDVLMWEEEPPTPELVDLVEESEGDVEMEEEDEDMVDPQYAQYLAHLELWGIPGDILEPDDVVSDVEEAASDYDDETDETSSSDGGNSSDDPDFEPSSYRERSDRYDAI